MEPEDDSKMRSRGTYDFAGAGCGRGQARSLGTAFALLAILLSLCFAPGGAGAETRGGAELIEHLEQAESAFRLAVSLDRSDPERAREQYERALLHYERLVRDDGVENGRLYYNIGNCYFKLGDLGRAILSYKRASLYIPGDENLKQNLEYARSRRTDRIDVEERERIFKTLFFLHYDVPLRIRLQIFAVAFAAIWIVGLLILLLDLRILRTLLIAAIVVSALFLFSIVAEGIGAVRNPEGVITAREIIARKGDADTYQPSFTEPLHAGTEFKVLETRPEWMHIELGDGSRGWIPRAAGDLVIR